MPTSKDRKRSEFVANASCDGVLTRRTLPVPKAANPFATWREGGPWRKQPSQRRELPDVVVQKLLQSGLALLCSSKERRRRPHSPHKNQRGDSSHPALSGLLI